MVKNESAEGCGLPSGLEESQTQLDFLPQSQTVGFENPSCFSFFFGTGEGLGDPKPAWSCSVWFQLSPLQLLPSLQGSATGFLLCWDHPRAAGLQILQILQPLG